MKTLPSSAVAVWRSPTLLRRSTSALDSSGHLGGCADDFFFASCQLEPVELGEPFEAVGSMLESGDFAGAAEADGDCGGAGGGVREAARV